MHVTKPWGHYVDHHRTLQLTCKTIVVEPFHSLSYQAHQDRTEFWYVVSGLGQLKLNEELHDLNPGDALIIKPRDKHQLINTSATELVVYEMQCGICDEEDITRYDS